MESRKLNKIEKLKRSLRPIDYHDRLESLTETELTEADRFYLKNFGIYNHKLAPRLFALRIRVPGGRLALSSLTKLVEHIGGGKRGVVITSRAQVEIHGLSLKEAVDLSRRIEGWGLTAWQTFTDNFRNIVTHPLDGIGVDALVPCHDLLLRMQDLFLKRPEFVGTIPRKFNTAVVGNRRQLFSPFANDLAFVVAQKGERIGFNLYAGGKNSEAARPLDLFVEPENAVDLFYAVATLYRDEGPRESRSRARLFHMIEAMGVKRFRAAVLERYGAKEERAGNLLSERGGFSARYPLKNGGVAYRYTTRFGEIDEASLDEVLKLCDVHGVEEVRLGCDQNLYLPDLPEGIRFRHETRRYGGIVACVGSKHCVYSLMDTKAEAADMALQKCEKHGVSVGFSGCLKGCARHAFSDIGLVGIRTGLYADDVERGVRLYLGAEQSRGGVAGRLVLYAIPMRHLDAMIDLIVDLFVESGYDDFESFSREWLNRYSEPALAFWLLHNRYRRRRGMGLWLPNPVEASDTWEEKSALLEDLEHSAHPEEREVIETLHREEAFAFREAIVFLERTLFSVKSPS